MTSVRISLLLILSVALVTAQWGRPPVVVEKTIITRPGFGGGPGFGRGPIGPGFGRGPIDPGFGRGTGWGPGRAGGWGGPQTIVKETIIRPG